MYYSKKLGLKPGDQIVEIITPLGIAKHFAIYLGWDNTGTEWIIENKKFDAVRLIKAADYSKTVLQVSRIQKFSGNNIARKLAVQNALKKIGKPYDLINYNCEHFVTEAITGKKKSRQVENAAIIVLAILFCVAIWDNLNLKK